jgi:hypothetical protein
MEVLLMARSRMIKPEFLDDPDVADLSFPARLFFIGLWMHADKEGRLADDTRRLKVRIFPYDPIDVESLAVELHAKDMIRRYKDSAGQGQIWIRTFTKHQHTHPREAESTIEPCAYAAGKFQDEPRNFPASPEKDRTGQEKASLGVASEEVPEGDTGKGAENPAASTSASTSTSASASTSSDHPAGHNLGHALVVPRHAKRVKAKPPESGYTPEFLAFWRAYPRKEKKAEAFRVWTELAPSTELTATILAALAWQAVSPKWREDHGTYIPHPTTYLNNSRWEDEPTQVAPDLTPNSRDTRGVAALKTFERLHPTRPAQANPMRLLDEENDE